MSSVSGPHEAAAAAAAPVVVVPRYCGRHRRSRSSMYPDRVRYYVVSSNP